MHLLITFARAYPRQSIITLLSLLLAGLMEGVGLSALFPLLSIASSSQAASQDPTINASESSPQLGDMVTATLSALGLSPTIGLLLLVIVTSLVLKSILVLFANKQVGYTVAHVATDLRLALIRDLLSTRWEYYLRQPVGALANAIATEAMRASNAYLHGAMVTALLIQAIVYAGVALLVSWEATLASLAAGTFLLYVLNQLVRMSRRAGLRQTKLLKSLLARLTDNLQSVKPLKAMGREKLADTLLEVDTNKLNKALQKEVFSKEALKAFQEPMLAALIAIGIYLAFTQWSLPLTAMMVLVFLLARVMAHLGKIQREYQKMVACESAYWSLEDTIKGAQQEREIALGSQSPRLQQAIRLDKVSFAYQDAWVLCNASLVIPAGSLTTLIGSSGTGKTTVVDLVTGLLWPQQGEVWIDDLPLSKADLRQWRKMIGYVPQEILLLNDTVLRNITLGDPQLTEMDVEQALRAAGAWEFVTTMPLGMHSNVGERGAKLSGGQRQRVAIARALVHKPALLILDEATSALDPESEAAICNTLCQLRGKLTLLAISHQPALIQAADQVYRLKNGIATLALEPHRIIPVLPGYQAMQ